jgi:hypothetical protein
MQKGRGKEKESLVPTVVHEVICECGKILFIENSYYEPSKM